MNGVRARTQCTDRDERILCVVLPSGFLVPDRSPEFSYRYGKGRITAALRRRRNGVSEPRQVHGREDGTQGCVTAAIDGAQDHPR